MQTREQFKTVTHVIPAGNKTAQMGLALIAALAAIIAFSLPIQGHAQTSVPHDWSLKPSGLDTRDKFRLLFASSTKRNANPSDIAIYNTFVQTRAAAGHTDIQAYSAGFKVVGCTGTVDATDNTGTTGTGVPIYWLDGDKVADDYADFYDGSWDSRSPTTETGASVTTTSTDGVITGCSAIGTDGGPRWVTVLACRWAIPVATEQRTLRRFNPSRIQRWNRPGGSTASRWFSR